MEIFRKFERGDQYYLSPKKLEKSLEDSPHYSQIVEYVESSGGSVKRDLLIWPSHRGGPLPDIGILRHYLAGNIVIEPFDIRMLQSNGYEVRVSDVFFRMKDQEELKNEDCEVTNLRKDVPVYDAYSKESVDLMWAGPIDPLTGQDVKDAVAMRLKGGGDFNNGYKKLKTFYYVNPEDKLITLDPSEMILARTLEQIGGKNIITTFVAGKSTPARHGFEICSDSFLGDVGFTYYWALEIVNKHSDVALYLVAGTPVATMIFFEHNEPPLKQYKNGTYYQGQGDVDGIRKIVPKPLKIK